MSDYGLLALGPLLVIALVASLFHLGNPLNAPRAVTNLGTSWLSREILASVLFVVVGGIFAIMQWRRIGPRALRNAIAVIAGLLGLALIFIMAQVYHLETQPAWNSWNTTLSFYATSFLLGVLGVAAAYVASYGYIRRKDPECAEVQCTLLHDALRGLSIAAIVLVGVEFVAAPLYVASLVSGPAAAQQTTAMLIDEYSILFTLRLALAFIGACVLGLWIYRVAVQRERETLLANLTYAAFGLVLVAEVLGRYLFYATHFKIGI
jgi:anaerobic dimethyl sulfoxide reductase subunit C (anchor subunit)